MTATQLFQSYREAATQTANPGQLVLMLYDGALTFLERALSGFQYDDPMEFNQTIHNNVARTQAILTELDNALNLEAGGELAMTLHRLYNYMDSRLAESDRRKQKDGIEDTITRLTALRNSWKEMLEKRTVETESTAPEPDSTEPASLMESA